jgi:hypothetical protein
MSNSHHRLAVINASVGAGKSEEDRIQALTLVELMYREDGRRDEQRSQRGMAFEHLAAADRYRENYLDAHGKSVGVQSYGQHPGGVPGWDRQGTSDQRLRARSILRAAQMAMYGVQDQDGRWVLDQDLANMVDSAIIETVDIPSKTKVGAQRTPYRGEKQLGAAGYAIVLECLRRLVLHYRLQS